MQPLAPVLPSLRALLPYWWFCVCVVAPRPLPHLSSSAAPVGSGTDLPGPRTSRPMAAPAPFRCRFRAPGREARLALPGPSPWRRAGAARYFRPPPDVAAGAPQQSGAAGARGRVVAATVAPPAFAFLLLLPPAACGPAPSRPPPRLWLTGECGGPQRPSPLTAARGPSAIFPPSETPAAGGSWFPAELWAGPARLGSGSGGEGPGPGRGLGEARAAGGPCAGPPLLQARSGERALLRTPVLFRAVSASNGWHLRS